VGLLLLIPAFPEIAGRLFRPFPRWIRRPQLAQHSTLVLVQRATQC